MCGGQLHLDDRRRIGPLKWFVPCVVSDDPLPVQAVSVTNFFLFLALFLALFYLACAAEQTRFGAMVSKFLDQLTEPLRHRVEDLLRAAAAVFFALLWAHGGLFHPGTRSKQCLALGHSVADPAFPGRAGHAPGSRGRHRAALCLWCRQLCLFHMLDYPVFPGLGVCFALSLSRNAKLLAFRSDFLRWTVALSLLWPAMEKFVYPAWVAPIAVAHPELTLGFDVSTVVTAAGVVEFGLAFALFWTPRPASRRPRAGAGADRRNSRFWQGGRHRSFDDYRHTFRGVRRSGRRPARYRPALAPLVGSMALPATLLLYTGAHTLSYTSLTTRSSRSRAARHCCSSSSSSACAGSRKVRARYATRAGRTSCAKSRIRSPPGLAPRNILAASSAAAPKSRSAVSLRRLSC